MRIKAAIIAIAMLFGFTAATGIGPAAAPAEAQRYDRPGYNRGYHRPPPRYRNRGYRARRYYGGGRRYYGGGRRYAGARQVCRREWRGNRRVTRCYRR